MQSAKKSVQIIAAILKENEVHDVVFSPGSRNAPLVIQFCEDAHFKTLSIADERCAAFFALGIAQFKQTPSVICCTSGTASLNYAPAIAEAYYQGIPMLIITADRPREWIDHGEGQSIRQNNIYHNYIKGSFDLPQDISNDQQKWYCNRLVNEALNLCVAGKPGPVHINLPFSEPLYDTSELPLIEERTIDTIENSLQLDATALKHLVSDWNQYNKKLIICGQMPPQNKLNTVLEELAQRPDVAIIAESISNLNSRYFNHHIDRSIVRINDDNIDQFKPDLLISIGTAIVSKKIKALFRSHQPLAHWHVNESGYYQDMFKCLSKVIKSQPSQFFSDLSALTEPKSNDFQGKWLGLGHHTAMSHDSFLETAPYSDLTAYHRVMDFIPEHTNIHLANSTAIRYAQLFPVIMGANYYCNRGTSGIDGSTSTALGSNYSSKKPTVLLTGDIAFFYDSNAFWNNADRHHFKVILFNNSGGGIFRIIDGPNGTNHLESHFETTHNLRAEKLAEMHNIGYACVSNIKELDAVLPDFLNPDNTDTCILEVVTDPSLNPTILKDYFNFLKQ